MGKWNYWHELVALCDGRLHREITEEEFIDRLRALRTMRAVNDARKEAHNAP
jgi:hypothetical protein